MKTRLKIVLYWPCVGRLLGRIVGMALRHPCFGRCLFAVLSYAMIDDLLLLESVYERTSRERASYQAFREICFVATFVGLLVHVVCKTPAAYL